MMNSVKEEVLLNHSRLSGTLVNHPETSDKCIVYKTRWVRQTE